MNISNSLLRCWLLPCLDKVNSIGLCAESLTIQIHWMASGSSIMRAKNVSVHFAYIVHNFITSTKGGKLFSAQMPHSIMVSLLGDHLPGVGYARGKRKKRRRKKWTTRHMWLLPLYIQSAGYIQSMQNPEVYTHTFFHSSKQEALLQLKDVFQPGKRGGGGAGPGSGMGRLSRAS